jgi:hypothetical protein
MCPKTPLGEEEQANEQGISWLESFGKQYDKITHIYDKSKAFPEPLAVCFPSFPALSPVSIRKLHIFGKMSPQEGNFQPFLRCGGLS